MADKVILADTSILIEYFRKTEKNSSSLIKLSDEGYVFFISSITEYEIYSGATYNQLGFWDKLLINITVLPFDQAAVKMAVEINNNLKRTRKQIGLPDLFIASTAKANSIPIATLNSKHFDRIEGLQIVAPSKIHDTNQ